MYIILNKDKCKILLKVTQLYTKERLNCELKLVVIDDKTSVSHRPK